MVEVQAADANPEEKWWLQRGQWPFPEFPSLCGLC